MVSGVGVSGHPGGGVKITSHKAFTLIIGLVNIMSMFERSKN